MFMWGLESVYVRAQWIVRTGMISKNETVCEMTGSGASASTLITLPSHSGRSSLLLASRYGHTYLPVLISAR